VPQNRRVESFDGGHFHSLREGELKRLSPEWLLCLAAECSSGQPDVLQDVIIELVKVAQRSARPHAFPPASQQTQG